MAFTNMPGNTAERIEEADRSFVRLANSGKTQTDWERYKEEALGLDWSNRRIQLARGTTLYDFDPNSDSYDFERRFDLGNRQFDIAPLWPKIWKSFLTAVAFGLGALVVLLILRWFWYFFLDRLAELSRAFQGKRGES